MTPQAEHDAEECVLAYDCGGAHLAELTYRAVIEARGLTTAEAVRLRGRIRKTLDRRGVSGLLQEQVI